MTAAPTMTLLADPAIDPNQMLLTGIDTSAGPLYTVSEMAMFFFVRSPHWVRWTETCHFVLPNRKPCPIAPAAHTGASKAEHAKTWKMVLDGELLQPLRTSSNARQYDLALIEKIAHALASNGAIKAGQLRQALLLVRVQAEMHGYI